MPPVFLKILPTLAMLLAVEMPAKAVEAGALPAQSAPMETTSAPVSGLPALQSSATLPPDSSPFVPDGPKKQKRVKEILDQINATSGFSRGREEFFPSWGPLPGKLYALHKELTDSDWQLLAEMYVSFSDSGWTLLVSLPVDSNSKGASNLDAAMTILLAMHGKASIDTLNKMVATASNWPPKYYKGSAGIVIYNRSWQGMIRRIKMFAEDKPWSNTSEYKKDQQSENEPSK